MDLFTDNPILGYEAGRRVWRFANGRILPFVGGSDGDDCPTLPEDLTSLTDEQVGGLEGELLAWFAAHRPTAATPEDVAALTSCAERIEALRNLAADRFAAAAGTPAVTDPAPAGGDVEPPAAPAAGVGDALAALDAQVGATFSADPPAVPPAAEPAADEGRVTVNVQNAIDPALIASIAAQVGTAVVDAMTAAATPGQATPGVTRVIERPRLSDMARYRPAGQAPEGAAGPQMGFPATVTASTSIPGLMDSGQQISDPAIVAQAMAERWNLDKGKAETGAGERVTIAHLVASADEGMRLRKGEDQRNAEKIAAFIEGRSLTAAGGLCAPVTPLYDQPVISTAIRPFRAGFPTFLADRGGVRIVAPPTMADIVGTTPPSPNPTNLGDGVGTITVSQDQAGTPLKSCLDVPCHSSAEYDVEAIYRCLQFANLGARVFPEQVVAFNRLAMAVQAQKAETLLLDAVAAVAHQLTFAKTFGTSRQLLAQLEHAAAQFRNVNRMEPDAVLQVRMPAWALNAMRADLTSSFHDDPVLFSAADTVLESWFADRNLAVGYFIDSPTSQGQLFAAVGSNGTAFPDYPTTVVTFMWAEGAFLFLDQGTLDIGIVRDSTLVAENRFRDFAETWEGLAWTGLPVYQLTHTISNDGSYGAAVAIAAAAGSGL